MPADDDPLLLPLLRRAPEEVVCRRADGEAITCARFLAEATALAARLPERGEAVNLCTDRYLALVGFAAALLRGQVTLLCADRSPYRLRRLAERYPEAYALADEAALELPMPALRPDVSGAAEPGALPMPRIPADQVAAIAFTSGSTGEPTAHAKPWGSLVLGAEAAAERFGLRHADGPPATVVATVPPQHMYGFETTMMLPLHSAAASFAGETFFPQDVFAALASAPGRRVLVTTPLQLRALLAAEGGPSRRVAPAIHAPAASGRDDRGPALGAVISATAPLATALAAAVEERWGVPVLEIYGATEAGSIASRRTVEGEAWLPYRGTVLRGGAVAIPGLGEIPLADAVEPLPEGGRFRLLGRRADVVKLGGRRASLADLNRLLADVEGVQDGVFVAPEDLESNPAARLTAYVVAPGRTTEEILAALRQRVEAVFLPRPVVLLPALPRDRLGKLSRHALAELRRSAHDG